MARARRSVVILCAGLAALGPGLPAAAQEAGSLTDAAASGSVVTTDPAAVAAPLALPLRGTLNAAPPNSVVRPVQSAVRPAGRVDTLRSFAEDPADADPYAPLGLRLGSFVIAPEVSSRIVHTDNGTGASDGEPASFVATDASVALRSAWERHALALSIRGGFTEYLSGGLSEDPSFGTDVEGRIDLTEVDRIDLGAGYSIRAEDLSSDDVPAGSSSAPTIEVLSGTAGFTRNAGLIGMALKGSVDRSIYGASADFDSAARTNTAVAGSLRLSLDSGAAIMPFVEGGLFRRYYDRDDAGVSRDGAGWEIKGGVAVDTGLVAGELAAGYAVERFDDASLADLRGFLVDGSLAWRPTELVTLSLSADTSFAPTTLSGASGSVVSSLDWELSYLFRPNVTFTLGAGLTRQDYAGIDRTVDGWSLSAGTAWRLNRSLELTTTVRHERSNSSEAGDDSRETRIEAGLTLRR
ncbi:outer membrane beta-barrel protein [Methylobrevis albus]|uniref:Outer membrane beta-barrel protein n=1 Tax=Methylobrevis albus TaxID=2793297 RepID=A0A931MZW9_9HYPH|nr:outer membrane beta-barrel protein [Methylobrevis albus]MBH0239455.1 outer membrane beta-barrel protein [Methylobrevis albus]